MIVPATVPRPRRSMKPREPFWAGPVDAIAADIRLIGELAILVCRYVGCPVLVGYLLKRFFKN